MNAPARISVSKNFFLDEFVDPHTYMTRADHGLSLIDENLFKIVQHLRDLKGSSIGINNWWGFLYANKGNALEFLHWCEAKRVYVWSGYRSPLCHIGASQSAHKQGRAADPKGDQKLYYNLVKDNAESFYKLGLRRLEDISITPGWLHVDTLERNTQPNSIRVVDLKKCTHTIRW